MPGICRCEIDGEEQLGIIKSRLLTVSSKFFEVALGVIFLRNNVYSLPSIVHRPQFIIQLPSQANLFASVSNRHFLVSPTLGRHLDSFPRCKIVSIHPTHAYMWVMNNIPRCGIVIHLILPDTVLMPSRGITGSLSPPPEPRSWG